MFWFPQAVPETLRLNVGAILGRPGKPAWELKWSLRTHDVRAVKQAMLEAIKKADAILEAARNGPRPLTPGELRSLADLWVQRKLRQWDADPASFHGIDHWDELMPTDQFEEGTENDEEPVVSARWKQEWKRFVARFLDDADELLAAECVLSDPPQPGAACGTDREADAGYRERA
jgi:hypothetical protein